MKRPNIDRMRKHAARSTPDKVSRTFTEKEVLGRGLHLLWMDRYRRQMILKHGPHGVVDAEVQQDPMNHTYQITLTTAPERRDHYRRMDGDVNARMRQILWDGL